MGKSDATWIPDETDLGWIESVGAEPAAALLAIEAAARPKDVPIVDRHTGRVLQALAGDRRRVLEVGTAYGYSTLWMALGQPDGGTIVTIDPDAGRTALARGWWRDAGIEDGAIVQVTAPALEAFAADDLALRGPFDLVFIDALKHEYGAYLAAAIPRLAPRALVLADNVLWSGRVSGARPAPSDDGSVDALRTFSTAVLADTRFAATILPVGDGILIARWLG